MTPTELRAALAALGWTQGELARRYGVNPRTIRGYLVDGDAIPPALARFIALAQAGGGPRFVFGDAVGGPGEYLVHLRRPRFVARVVEEGGDDEEDAGADTLAGLTLALGDGILLCEVDWIDDPRGDLGDVLAAARAAVLEAWGAG